jgi:hypothetical protein
VTLWNVSNMQWALVLSLGLLDTRGCTLVLCKVQSNIFNGALEG